MNPPRDSFVDGKENIRENDSKNGISLMSSKGNGENGESKELADSKRFCSAGKLEMRCTPSMPCNRPTMG